MSITLEQQASALLDACIALEAELAKLRAVADAARRMRGKAPSTNTFHDVAVGLDTALAALDAPADGPLRPEDWDYLRVAADEDRHPERYHDCPACQGTGKVQR